MLFIWLMPLFFFWNIKSFFPPPLPQKGSQTCLLPPQAHFLIPATSFWWCAALLFTGFWGCYGLNVCGLSKFICWNFIPQCEGIRKWGHGEVIRVEPSWMGWVPLEGSREGLLPLFCSPLYESATLKRASTRTSHCYSLIIQDQLPKNKFLLLHATQFMIFCYGSLSQDRGLLCTSLISFYWSTGILWINELLKRLYANLP